jgi:membrane protein required for colicin V production
MEGFTIFDGAVAGVILISAVLAFSRGFVREAMSIVAWIAAAVVAFWFAPTWCR